MIQTRTQVLFTMLLLTLSLFSQATEQNPHVRINAAGLGLDGYSPVSYFEHGQAELGSAAFEHPYQGVTYRLTNAQQLQQFRNDPEAYLPAHGGWCSLMLSGSGRMTPANPESFTIVDGQLLLFWDGQFKGQAVSGLSNWHSKTNHDPKKERKRLHSANKTWQKIKQGKKAPQVVIFDAADQARLSQKWLSKAKKKY